VTGLRRFTLTPEQMYGDRVMFDRDESHHMWAVLRLAPGDLVVATDGHGHEYTVRLESLGEVATGTIVRTAPGGGEPPLAITLVQGIPKGDKMEAIVRAATELGVHRVMPAITARTVVRLEASRWRERARRWQRVAKEATKQCGRAFIPEIEMPRPIQEWLEPGAASADLRLCLWEGQAPSLASVCKDLSQAPATVLVVVGPEGGLARDEVELARSRGLTVASLGPRILRTETAGPAAIAILQFQFGDLGGTAP
jgi:16S rRNA (uracil1498-N3)-methyltransferase